MPITSKHQHYYPFGLMMPGRSWSDGYRYGFQNQEQDDELWGGAISFKYRVEDPRLGRFFSVDPLGAEYPYNSPYAFSENRVIDAIELEGLEKVQLNDGSSIETGPIEPQAQIERFENSPYNDGSTYITSYGGGIVLEPVIINSTGNGGSLTTYNPYNINHWENAPNRQPFDGFWGVLDYYLNGGQEGGVRYNVKGKPVGPAFNGGAGSLGWIGGPKSSKQIFNAVKVVNATVETASGILKPGGKLIGTQVGQNPAIRTITLSEAESVVNRLITSGGKLSPKPGYPGVWYQLPNGGSFGVRNTVSQQSMSLGSSGAIDLNIPGIALKNLKF